MTHEARVSTNTSWVTPKWILDWVGAFDLDPATFDGHPWPCAIENRTIGGLLTPWHGRVFLNPPYASRQIEPFMERMAAHRNGVAVVACRIETEWFQRFVFGAAQAVFFPRGRIRFCNAQGQEARAVAFPSCVAFYEPPPAAAPRPGTWWFARAANGKKGGRPPAAYEAQAFGLCVAKGATEEDARAKCVRKAKRLFKAMKLTGQNAIMPTITVRKIARPNATDQRE